jgi:type IV pilus assembly protein PilN
MRLNINLATRPYEDAREFWTRWGAGVGLLAVVTLLLLGWTVRNWIEAGHDRHNIAELQQMIASRDRERTQAQSFLDLPANHSTRDQSQFLNGLIRRKSFSWTLVFEALEQVVPPNLHVVSLRPEFTDQNTMLLDMKVAGENRSAAVELVHRMEGSARFQNAQLTGEQEQEGGSAVIASVVTIYIPQDAKESGKDAKESANVAAKESGK